MWCETNNFTYFQVLLGPIYRWTGDNIPPKPVHPKITQIPPKVSSIRIIIIISLQLLNGITSHLIEQSCYFLTEIFIVWPSQTMNFLSVFCHVCNTDHCFNQHILYTFTARLNPQTIILTLSPLKPVFMCWMLWHSAHKNGLQWWKG